MFYRLWFYLNKARLIKAADEFDQAVRQYREEPMVDAKDNVDNKLNKLLHASGLPPLRPERLGRNLFLQRGGPKAILIDRLELLATLAIFNTVLDVFTFGWSGFLTMEYVWHTARLILLMAPFVWLLVRLGDRLRFELLCLVFMRGMLFAHQAIVPLGRFLTDNYLPHRLEFLTNQLSRFSLEVEFMLQEVIINPKHPKAHFLLAGVEDVSDEFVYVGAWLGDIEGKKETAKETKLAEQT